MNNSVPKNAEFILRQNVPYQMFFLDEYWEGFLVDCWREVCRCRCQNNRPQNCLSGTSGPHIKLGSIIFLCVLGLIALIIILSTGWKSNTEEPAEPDCHHSTVSYSGYILSSSSLCIGFKYGIDNQCAIFPNGRLAIITSANVSEVVSHLRKWDTGISSFELGLKQLNNSVEPDEGWVWPMVDGSGSFLAVDIPWATYQPNDGRSDRYSQDCGVFVITASDFGMDDITCTDVVNRPRPKLCQYGMGGGVEYIDTEECGGNRANDPNTIINAKDQYKCTHMLGAAYTVGIKNTLKTQTGNPQDCCQMCSKDIKCGFYTWRDGKCILFDEYYKIDTPLSVDVDAISGEKCSSTMMLNDNDVDERQNFIEKSGQCTYLPGIDIRSSKNDHKFNPGSKMNIPVRDCCNLCLNTVGCLGYSWSSGTCYFRSSLANIRPKDMYVSGEVCIHKEAFKDTFSTTTTTTVTSHHFTKINTTTTKIKPTKNIKWKGMSVGFVGWSICIAIGAFLALALAMFWKSRKPTKKAKVFDEQSISATNSSDVEFSEIASDSVEQQGKGSEESSEEFSQDESTSETDG